jgi:hypothetical protein
MGVRIREAPPFLTEAAQRPERQVGQCVASELSPCDVM